MIDGRDQAVLEFLALQGRAHRQIDERLTTLTQQGSDQRASLIAEQRARTKLEQQVARLAQQVADLAQQTADQAARSELLLAELTRQTTDQAVRSFVDRDLQALSSGCAELLNYAPSHRGFAAQAGLYINHPVWIEHSQGAVTVGAVNERIIEIPYVLAALKEFPRGSCILDFGATESTLALSLASSGYHVIALDLRPYPLPHPRIESVVHRAEEWEGPSRPVDAIISLSTLEHVGLSHYDTARSHPDLDMDRQLIERFRSWLPPDGLLILTAPFGPWRVDDFQRTYDSDHLDALLDGWTVLHRAYGFTADLHCWETLDSPPALDALQGPTPRAVVMLQATPAG
jgi:2-polyprenyl-3-methyl-5-hydroxy-6-metoxy-1,4-benzoquinol methylase